jgi:Zn finger protein HypA/HybF involved in hydrogenase expression
MLKREKRKFICYNCQNRWEEPYETGRPEKCPKCGSPNIHRPPEDRGYMNEEEV